MATVRATEQNFEAHLLMRGSWVSTSGQTVWPAPRIWPRVRGCGGAPPGCGVRKGGHRRRAGARHRLRRSVHSKSDVIRDGVLLATLPGARPAAALDALIGKVRTIDMGRGPPRLEAHRDEGATGREGGERLMCRRADCPKCGRPTYAGCGMHVEQVLGNVPPAQRCRCRQKRSRTRRPAPRPVVFGHGCAVYSAGDNQTPAISWRTRGSVLREDFCGTMPSAGRKLVLPPLPGPAPGRGALGPRIAPGRRILQHNGLVGFVVAGVVLLSACGAGSLESTAATGAARERDRGA